MKRLIFIILLFCNYWANSQTTDIYSTRQVPGTGTYKNNQSNHFANSVFDQNLRIPSHASNGLYGAKDSSGYIYFNTTINRIIAYRGTGVWDTLATNSFINPNLVYKSGANQTITQLPTFSAGIATNGINSTDDINTTHNTTAVGVYGQNLSLHNNLNGFATQFVPQSTNTANVNIQVRNQGGVLALLSDIPTSLAPVIISIPSGSAYPFVIDYSTYSAYGNNPTITVLQNIDTNTNNVINDVTIRKISVSGNLTTLNVYGHTNDNTTTIDDLFLIIKQ